MEVTEVIILLVILLLAIPFGYFLHKALHSVVTKNLLEQLEQLKLIDSQRQTLVSQLKSENSKKTEALDKLQKEYFHLTLASKELQEKETILQKKLLEKQYDIPPDYPLLKESNALLQQEIQRSREKVKKWKSKDFLKANKKLVKKVKGLKNRVVALRDENEKYEQSHKILSQIRELTQPMNNSQPQVEATIDLDKNPFAHQPEFSKSTIFKNIFPSSKEITPAPVIDLHTSKRSLLDLAGMDNESLDILAGKGINSFEDLVQVKIKKLRGLFSEHSANYPYDTWPIQARLALRGEWELIEEYKRK